MKHLIKTILLFLACTTLNAQEHLQILDVPINGTLEQVAGELQLRGLVRVNNLQDNIAVLHGNKNGQQIDYLVVATDDAQHVYRITVLTQPKFKWKTLLNEYRYYKKSLAEQYGCTPDVYEFFKYPYDTKKTQRRHEMQALHEGKAQFASFYNLTNAEGDELGTIMLQLTTDSHFARVIAVYEDKANSEQYAPETK